MKLFRMFAAVGAVFLLLSCSADGVIEVETPERPAGQEDMIGYAAPPMDVVRVGFIGLGMRGPGAVERFCHIEGTDVKALCDLRPECVDSCNAILAANGRHPAEVYTGTDDAWKRLCERDDIDLVYICTDWKHHAEMAVYAMEQGKHVAVEVPAAMSIGDIWRLIDTSERTRRHCMQLENCVYDFFELTTLNMAQKGLFGEILHAEGAYIHNLEEFWDEYWDDWRLQYNREHRGDVYPTHGIGPACQALDIHRGDRMDYLVCVDTKTVNGRRYYEENRGPVEEFRNGDHTVTMIRTVNGKSILIQHNVVTPRPYNRLYQLIGTEGFANKYPMEGYVVDPSRVEGYGDLPTHSFVPQDVKEALMQEYKHPIQVELEETARKVGGHGGMDYIMDYRLVYCLRNGLPLDMDVYDLAEWCCLTELTGISLDNSSAPVRIPDFTRGGWDRVKGYRHAFAE